MISCTEFIPSYSELFTFLEKNYGRDEVDRFWEYLFEPTGEGIPLINFLKKEGIKGCFTYWGGTLNEEAADFTMYLNEKDGWFKIDMHHCPSKGRLLELKDKTGIEPGEDEEYLPHPDVSGLRIRFKINPDFNPNDNQLSESEFDSNEATESNQSNESK